MDTKQLIGQGVAETGTQVHEGAQHSGVGGINMPKKKKGLAPCPTHASRSLADFPWEWVSRVKLHQSDCPAAAARWQGQPAYGRLLLLGKGEEEVCITPLTPQLICLHGFSHAMRIRLQSSREISSDNKYAFKTGFYASFTWPDKQCILLFYCQGAVTKKCHENLALKQYAEQNFALEQLMFGFISHFFHPDILSSKKADETRELGTPLVEQRLSHQRSVVVALEHLLHVPGQTAWLEKKGTAC